MRLIDKDKFLRELIENPKYEDIGNLDDAIEAVKYADEVDLSEHDKQIQKNEKEKAFDEAYAMLADELIWVLHTYGDDVYISVADSISSTFRQLLKEQNPDYEKEQNLSQPLPAIDNEEEKDEERASEISENFEEYDDEEDGFDPGDDD